MKEQLKLEIEALAEEKSITLPHSWQNKSEENLQKMLADMKAESNGINTTKTIVAEPKKLTVEEENAALKLQIANLENAKLKAQIEVLEMTDEEEAKLAKELGHVSIIDMKRESKSFLKQLQEEEYVDIEIDPSSIYPEGSTVPIGLNGVTFHVPVGKLFEKGVPKSIKQTWDYSKRETRKAMTALKKKMTGEIKIQ